MVMHGEALVSPGSDGGKDRGLNLMEDENSPKKRMR
jgi:hypothetical protein